MDSKRGQNEQKTRFSSAGPTLPTQTPKTSALNRLLLINTDPRFRKLMLCSPKTLLTAISPPAYLPFWSQTLLSKILFKLVSGQTNTQSGWTLTTELINPDVESLTQPSLTLPVRKAPNPHNMLRISNVYKSNVVLQDELVPA